MKEKAKGGVWQRGYMCHHFKVNGKTLGTVNLGPLKFWDRVYRWSCPEANLRGGSSSLVAAKQAVEHVVRSGVYQPDLFGFSEVSTSGAATPPAPKRKRLKSALAGTHL